jgi:hypothetical protein
MANRNVSNVVETVTALNSAVRTLLGLAIVGGLAYAGWYGFSVYNEKGEATKQLAEAKSALTLAQHEITEKERSLAQKNVEIHEKTAQISDLNDKVEQQQLTILRLDTSLRFLKVDRRVARLKVLDQSLNEDDELISLVEFQELDGQGKPLDQPKQFPILGDTVYIDSWVVKFDDKYVEEADVDRATSLIFFRRIFGEFQEPHDGFPLDAVGERPTAYSQGVETSDFEQRIWRDFWNVANDEFKQAELGIRAAHGDAPSIKVKKGNSYRIQLRASDGLSITPEPTSPRG